MSNPPTLPSEIRVNLDQLPEHQGVSEKHAAAILGVSVSKLQKDRVRGSGPEFVKHGKTKFARVTYRIGALRAYQQEHTHRSTSTYLATGASLGEFGLVRPYAVSEGRLSDFLTTLSEDVDEIVWLTAQEAAMWETSGGATRGPANRGNHNSTVTESPARRPKRNFRLTGAKSSTRPDTGFSALRTRTS